MTLIDKLNEHKETIAVLRGTEKQGSHEFTFLGHHLLGFQTAINIVKEHKCTWDDCSDASYVPCCDIVFCYNPEETQPDFVFCPYCGGEHKYKDGEYIFIDSDYDTTDWQHSAIDKDLST